MIHWVIENGNRDELHDQNQLKLLAKYWSGRRKPRNIAVSWLLMESGNQRRSNISETIQKTHWILILVITTIHKDVKSKSLNTSIQRVGSNMNNDAQKKPRIYFPLKMTKETMKSSEISLWISFQSHFEVIIL